MFIIHNKKTSAMVAFVLSIHMGALDLKASTPSEVNAPSSSAENTARRVLLRSNPWDNLSSGAVPYVTYVDESVESNPLNDFSTSGVYYNYQSDNYYEGYQHPETPSVINNNRVSDAYTQSGTTGYDSIYQNGYQYQEAPHAINNSSVRDVYAQSGMTGYNDDSSYAYYPEYYFASYYVYEAAQEAPRAINNNSLLIMYAQGDFSHQPLIELFTAFIQTYMSGQNNTQNSNSTNN